MLGQVSVLHHTGWLKVWVGGLTHDTPTYHTYDTPAYHTRDTPTYHTHDTPTYRTHDTPTYHAHICFMTAIQ